MQFEGSGWSGIEVRMDAASEFGGHETAPRPLELLLVGLAGCTGMDVVSLLGKMRVDFTGLVLEIEAEKSAEHPRVFTEINLDYIVTGRRIDGDKVKRAIELSQDKYCSVSAMLRKACPVNWSYRIVRPSI
ncbi:MAG: OsmC family protein [candidate division WOR-3 bacterium]|nr:MAG: OsmC family protein [candidate division WOR-3 bacterium]